MSAPDTCSSWSWSGNCILITVAGKRKRYRITKSTGTTVAFEPLLWRERLYFYARDALMWLKNKITPRPAEADSAQPTGEAEAKPQQKEGP